jgi:CHRD domain
VVGDEGRVKLAGGVAALVAVSVAGTVAVAGGGDSIREELTGYEEDPLVLSTTGNGSFKARISSSPQQISYRLRYADLEGSVLQAHIHLGGAAQSGGISVFLCSNLGNGPAGTQLCPPATASVSGTLRPSDVIGPAAQGIAAGESDELVDAIRAGVTYANVHSSKYPGGEIRAQLEGDDDGDSDD